jgi:mannose-6-phosphate isomerase-like protein (cupin superfamily)
MFFEDFKTKYKTIPFASYSRIHKKNTCFHNKQTILHMHKEIEMLIVLSGEAKVEIEHTEYNIEKNDIVIIPPYTLHRYTLFADKDISHCCICFDAKLLYDSALVQNLEQGTLRLPFLIKNEPTLFNYIHNSFNEHTRNGDGWEFKVIGNLSLLFGDMKSAGYLYKTNTPHVASVYS